MLNKRKLKVLLIMITFILFLCGCNNVLIVQDKNSNSNDTNKTEKNKEENNNNREIKDSNNDLTNDNSYPIEFIIKWTKFIQEKDLNNAKKNIYCKNGNEKVCEDNLKKFINTITSDSQK